MSTKMYRKIICHDTKAGPIVHGDYYRFYEGTDPVPLIVYLGGATSADEYLLRQHSEPVSICEQFSQAWANCGQPSVDLLILPFPPIEIGCESTFREDFFSTLFFDILLATDNARPPYIGLVGYNVDLLSYLFGNILSIRSEEVVIAALLFLGVMLMLTLYYHELFAISFSDELAKVSGIHTSFINSILVLLTALSVILAMKLVGIMLISSLLIVPAAGALQLACGFKVCILLAAIQGCSSVIIGIIISIMSNLPASATIVLVNLLFFAAACVMRRFICLKFSFMLLPLNNSARPFKLGRVMVRFICEENAPAKCRR